MDQATYESRERHALMVQLCSVENAPLADRQTAREDWRTACINWPDTIGERVGWLLDGCYGKGSYDSARAIADNTRMNRVAALGQMTHVWISTQRGHHTHCRKCDRRIIWGRWLTPTPKGSTLIHWNVA